MKVGDERLCLRDLVRMFSISFRIRPTYVGLVGDGLEIGFEMELIGTHQNAGQHLQGGCAQCLRVLQVLLELADLSLSKEESTVQRASARFEKLIRYASTTGIRPEIVVGMKVVRGAGLEQLAGDPMGQFTEDIRTVLRNLGCQEILFDYIPEPRLGESATLAGSPA